MVRSYSWAILGLRGGRTQLIANVDLLIMKFFYTCNLHAVVGPATCRVLCLQYCSKSTHYAPLLEPLVRTRYKAEDESNLLRRHFAWSTNEIQTLARFSTWQAFNIMKVVEYQKNFTKMSKLAANIDCVRPPLACLVLYTYVSHTTTNIRFS